MQTRGSETAEIPLDVDLVQAARTHGIDVRAAAEAGVRMRLDEQIEREKERDDIRKAMQHVDRYVEEHGSFADAWRQF